MASLPVRIFPRSQHEFPSENSKRPTMPRAALWVVVIAWGLLSPERVDAGFITFTFTGTVDGVGGTGAPVQVGDVFTVYYTFDPNTPDTSPYPSIEGQYAQTSGSGITVLVHGLTFFASGNGAYGTAGYMIRAQNDTGLADTYSVQAGPQGGPLNGQPDITLHFEDTTQTAFDSNALPATFNLAAWSSNYTVVSSPDGWAFGGTNEGFSSSVVPVPFSFLLFTTGIVGLLVYGQRWKRSENPSGAKGDMRDI